MAGHRDLNGSIQASLAIVLVAAAAFVAAVSSAGSSTGDQNSCSVFGSMHVLTFDGATLNFQYPCTYALVRTCSRLAPANVDVRIKTKTLNSLGAIGLQYVEIKAEGQSIQLHPNGSIYNNGILTEAYNYKCRINVQRGPIGIEATVAGAELSVLVNENGMVVVRIGPKLRTFLCGACGNYDGDPMNDRVIASSYGDWFISDVSDRSCRSLPQVDVASIDSRIRACTRRYEMQGRLTCDWFSRSSASNFYSCSAAYRQLAAAFYDACLYDTCIIGSMDEEGSGSGPSSITVHPNADDSVVCPLAEAFATQCYYRGRAPLGWRENTACVKTCTRGSLYSVNTTSCPSACSASDADCRANQCAPVYVEGCACPAGQQWSGSSCQKKSSCGCSYAGRYYSDGATWLDDTCSAQIQCSNGKLDYSPIRCVAKSECRLVAGSTKCVCLEGYQGDGRRQCTRVCGPGKYVSPLNDGCEECPIGTYQPAQNTATKCISCPSSLSTIGTGSVSATQCADLDMLPYQNRPSMCRTYDCIRRVSPPSSILKKGVPFGTRQYKTVSVSSNGLIALGEDFVGRYPGNLMDATNGNPVLAPFWLRQDFKRSPSSKVIVEEHSIRDSQTMLQAVNRLISKAGRQADRSFSAVWALVVTWLNVSPLRQVSAPPFEYANYQAVMATDGINTYAAYLYPEGGLNLSDIAAESAYMGYTSGEKRNSMAYSFYGSGTALMGRLDRISSNTGSPGKWIFKVSAISTSPEQLDCLQWYAQQAAVWTLSSPTANACPCNYAAAVADPRFRVNANTKCATSLFPDKLYSFYQMCCYDTSARGCGRLLTGTKDQGGPVQYSPYSAGGSQAHNVNDRKPFKDCCQESSNCNLYRQYRPSTTCRNYNAPRCGAGRGDPHFRTLDGLYYTYNGIGEYYLLKSENMHVQIRLGKTAGLQASEISALAAQALNPTSARVHVEVKQDKTGMITMIQSPSSSADDISVDTTSSDAAGLAYEYVTIYPRARGLRVAFENGFIMDIGLTAGMMEYTLYLPNDTLWRNASGLLGQYDGSKDNDLTLPNGTIVQCPNAQNDSLCIFNEFGPAWRITQAQSIFWYANGYNTASYTDYHYMPLFLDETNITLADSKFCSGNVECLYDLVATGNKTVAAATLGLYIDDSTTVKTFGTRSPSVTVDRTYLKAVVGFFTSFTVEVIPGSNQNVTIMALTLPNGSQLSRVSQYSYYFSWKPEDMLNSPSIQIAAVDTENVTSETVVIKIALCPGCGSHGTCMWPEQEEFDEFGIASCNCSLGWTGVTCELDVDGCADAPCQHGTCTDLPPGEAQEYTCDCYGGFQRWHLYGQEICTDVDECTEPPLAKCEQLCNNSIGSYFCSCTEGYQLQLDGTSCIKSRDFANATEEASESEGNACVKSKCPGLCLNVNNVSKCVCPEGFTLQLNNNDAQACIDVNECLSGAPCGTGTCLNINGSFLCKCADGYEEGAGKNSCIPCSSGSYGRHCAELCDCEGRAAVCDHVHGCTTCNRGWIGSQCRDDVDECEQVGTCPGNQSLCVNTPGSYWCDCEQGYKKTNSSDCADVDECSEELQPCQGEGFECYNTDGSFRCVCPAGYTLAGSECADINECLDEELCDENADCQNLPGSFLCQCKAGYKGNGQIQIHQNTSVGGCSDVNECQERSEICPMRSVCVNTVGSYECRCDAGQIAAGPCCVDSSIEWIHSSSCSEVAVCCDSTGEYNSHCAADFQRSPTSTEMCTTLVVSVTPLSATFDGTTRALQLMNTTVPPSDEETGDESSPLVLVSAPTSKQGHTLQNMVKTPAYGNAEEDFDKDSSAYEADADTEDEEREVFPTGATLLNMQYLSVNLVHSLAIDSPQQLDFSSFTTILHTALEEFYRSIPGFMKVNDLIVVESVPDTSRFSRELRQHIQANYTCLFSWKYSSIDVDSIVTQLAAFVAYSHASFTWNSWKFTLEGKIYYTDEKSVLKTVDCGICGGGGCQLSLSALPICDCCKFSWTTCVDTCQLERAVHHSLPTSLPTALVAALPAGFILLLIVAAVVIAKRQSRRRKLHLIDRKLSRSLSAECSQSIRSIQLTQHKKEEASG